MELCLLIFQAISGLKVNLFKSSMVGVSVEESSVSSFVEVMGYSVGNWSISYLRMPLGGNPITISFWDPVMETISKKLVCWKRGYFS